MKILNIEFQFVWIVVQIRPEEVCGDIFKSFSIRTWRGLSHHCADGDAEDAKKCIPSKLLSSVVDKISYKVVERFSVKLHNLWICLSLLETTFTLQDEYTQKINHNNVLNGLSILYQCISVTKVMPAIILSINP